MVASAANAVDVDYLARPREAQVEDGHETLAAGQGPGLVAVAGQEAQRLGERPHGQHLPWIRDAPVVRDGHAEAHD